MSVNDSDEWLNLNLVQEKRGHFYATSECSLQRHMRVPIIKV